MRLDGILLKLFSANLRTIIIINGSRTFRFSVRVRFLSSLCRSGRLSGALCAAFFVSRTRAHDSHQSTCNRIAQSLMHLPPGDVSYSFITNRRAGALFHFARRFFALVAFASRSRTCPLAFSVRTAAVTDFDRWSHASEPNNERNKSLAGQSDGPAKRCPRLQISSTACRRLRPSAAQNVHFARIPIEMSGTGGERERNESKQKKFSAMMKSQSIAGPIKSQF